MSRKTRLAKQVRRTIRKGTNQIGHDLIKDLLARSAWYRIKFAVNLVCKKNLFHLKG